MSRQRSTPETSPLGTSAPRRIHGNIAHDLGVAIVTGHHQPGEILPGEIEFSHRLDVSRSAYREAVRILAAKGLVESRPKTGTRVSDRRRWNMLDPDVLAWMFESEPDEVFIRSLFELRMMIEPAAAAFAAERRTADELSRMGAALHDMAHHGLASPAGRAADQLFHNLVLEATRNEPLTTLSTTIAAAVGWTTIFKQRRTLPPRDPMPEHFALYDAIAAGDGDLARVRMTELVALALRDTEQAVAA
ncbi:GntR family transcriptional regulator [Sphingomonas sp. Leaf339]|uniref:FadR/GntR family transcriptional regulator n=1 Tax=Sphingomonas sp. Leaf339 TaxID=1736343 RepID=UPI0006F94884|nr:FadR/GntR family transcriptional regulator [Sphingomonas sp. Leaf339]KQU62081.1 GntR family transcriptional regulator [Sphingomonas sp. Leaf339]